LKIEFFKILNVATLTIGIILIVLTANDRVTYGHGLGDLFYLIGLVMIVLIQSIALLRVSNKKFQLGIGVFTILLYSTFIYKLSIGRGIESPWNGQIIMDDPYIVSIDNDKDFDGVYVESTNEVIVKKTDTRTLNVTISIASLECAMPSYIGQLVKRKDQIFEGSVTAELEGYNDDSYHIKIEFYENSLKMESNDPWGKWELGAACWIEGDYEKK
jgi:hypothetical protein